MAEAAGLTAVLVAHPAGDVELDPRRQLHSWHRRALAAWDRLWFHEARHLVLPLAGLSAVSTVATASAPVLATWPLLLVALSPRLLFLSLAAPHAPALAFVAVATARLSLADPFHYRLGRTCASSATRRLPGFARRAFERSGHLQRPAAAVAVLLRPNGPSLAWAGSQRLPPPIVAALDLVGTLAYVLAVRAGASAWLG